MCSWRECIVCCVAGQVWAAGRGGAGRLARHWEAWLPGRVRTELDAPVTALAVWREQLQVWCGIRTGALVVLDRNLVVLARLEAHTRQVTGLLVATAIAVSHLSIIQSSQKLCIISVTFF